MPKLLSPLATLIALGVVLWAAPALAYPQWQLSTGNERCNQCHYDPAGGGLLTSYGRDAAGEELSTFGGDGALLHGLGTLPPWLALGGDLRGAFVAQGVQDPSGPTVAAFPMQADAEGRLALPGTGLSLSGTLGLRGQVRNPNTLVPYQNYQPVSTSELISREHYLMYQPETVGSYIRLGRFFAPFGLRFAEHTLYIRRDLGFDQLRETYNLSAGVVQPGWELHVTIFAPDFVRQIGSDESGAAAYYERRVARGTAAFALQGRVASAPGVTRFIGGAVGKAWVEPARTLLFAEVDGVNLVFDDPAVGTRRQIIAAAGFTVMPAPWLMGTIIGEHNQIDVALPDAWTAVDALVNWFPYAHFELQAMGRLQHPTGGDTAKTFFFQVHYFL
jgi:hypothetical protein